MPNHRLKLKLLRLLLLVTINSAAMAGPLEDANAAYEKKDFTRAIELFSPLADSGDQVALWRLGYMYVKGEGVVADTKRGFDLIYRASEMNNASALSFIASALSDQSPAKAYEFWLRAAEAGDALAQFNVATYLSFSIGGIKRNDAEAFSWYRKSAEQGHADAQYVLAQAYQAGTGTSIDYPEAMRWYKAAAAHGLATAQERIAYMYMMGQGVTQDYSEASKWQLRAAERGLALAQIQIGKMYMNGQGLPRDLVQAHKWINVALGSLPGSEQALRTHTAELLTTASKSMTSKQIQLAQKLAREWRAK